MLDKTKLRERAGEILANMKAYDELTTKDITKRTKGDKRRIQELEVELNEILEPSARSELIVDVHMAARFFQVKIRTIQNWIASGCPKLKHGMYDLMAIFAWWMEQEGSPNAEKGAAGSLKNAKLELIREHILLARLKRRAEEADFIPKEEVLIQWCGRIGELCSGLSHLENRILSLLADDARVELAPRLKSEIKLLRETYSRRGRFCEPAPKKSKA